MIRVPSQDGQLEVVLLMRLTLSYTSYVNKNSLVFTLSGRFNATLDSLSSKVANRLGLHSSDALFISLSVGQLACLPDCLFIVPLSFCESQPVSQYNPI